MNRYEEPIVEIIEIAVCDVITTSNTELTPQQIGGDNTYNWSDWF